MYKKKSLFVTFEGVEGSGKSYQSKKLFKKVKKIFSSTLYTREPGGTKSSEIIRKVILNDYFNPDSKEKFDKYTDTLLYLAARNEHIKNKIKPALNKKKVVICDRFTDSTLAYQHYGMGIDKKLILNLNKIILKKIKPNFTFVNTVNMKNLKYRINNRTKNRYDKFNINFYKKVQKGFIKLSKNKKNYMIINSNLSIFENKNKIINKVKSLI